MSKEGATPCYYSLLGLCKQSSPTEIRDAYRKLALQWHPDRWMKDPVVAGQAKRRFQQIQEAYSVLSNKGKKRIYDAGMLSLLGDDEDEEGNSLEDLQAVLRSMMAADESSKFDQIPTKRKRHKNLSGLLGRKYRKDAFLAENLTNLISLPSQLSADNGSLVQHG